MSTETRKGCPMHAYFGWAMTIVHLSLVLVFGWLTVVIIRNVNNTAMQDLIFNAKNHIQLVRLIFSAKNGYTQELNRTPLNISGKILRKVYIEFGIVNENKE